MKRKSPRDVPDFSHRAAPAHKGAPAERAPQPKSPGRTAPPPARVKPQSTSAKSGQRGR